MKIKKTDESEGSCFRPSGLVLAPVFFGWMCSLVVCVIVANRSSGFQEGLPRGSASEKDGIPFEIAKEQFETGENIRFFSQARPEPRDFIQELYRSPDSRDRVIGFFTELCASHDIAAAILAGADQYNISPALAFALSWEESRLNPLAVNNKNRDGSIDRGLFQLNDRSFPRLEAQAFFNPELNAKYGMSHLRHCLDTGGTEIAALAMYNAGTGRVRNSGTPKATLDYISRILENRRDIESEYLERETQFQRQTANFAEIAEIKPERHRLVPLMPLTGKLFLTKNHFGY